jgi:hypothetical protein
MDLQTTADALECAPGIGVSHLTMHPLLTGDFNGVSMDVEAYTAGRHGEEMTTSGIKLDAGENTLLSRFRGCFLGGALEDALGYPIKFSSLSGIRGMHPTPPVRLPCDSLRTRGHQSAIALDECGREENMRTVWAELAERHAGRELS